MIELVSQILQFVWELLPRPVLVRSTEVGVSILFGRWPRIVKPGLTIVWEVIQEWEVYPSIEQTIRTEPFLTESGQTWQISLSIDYLIIAPLQFHRSQQDGELKITTVAQRIACDMVVTDPSDLADRLTKALSGRGIVIMGVGLVSCCQFRQFKLAEVTE